MIGSSSTAPRSIGHVERRHKSDLDFLNSAKLLLGFVVQIDFRRASWRIGNESNPVVLFAGRQPKPTRRQCLGRVDWSDNGIFARLELVAEETFIISNSVHSMRC